ncbi:MAG: hypothetical protein AABM66_02055 [Actinomycetota bacterium]
MIGSRAHARTHRPDDISICRGFRRSQPTFYTEFDGLRPKRLIIKVLGE